MPAASLVLKARRAISVPQKRDSRVAAPGGDATLERPVRPVTYMPLAAELFGRRCFFVFAPDARRKSREHVRADSASLGSANASCTLGFWGTAAPRQRSAETPLSRSIVAGPGRTVRATCTD